MTKTNKNKKLWLLMGLSLFILVASIWFFEKGALLGAALAK
ncbi:hypothetical protein [Flavobacterium branchiicola]|uniref:Uncharacterized protein n=1 Tax=Flavobacterium branchiicola TaxID=1114875 RepID=A0ABV9PFY0_9FLAO|nr:hypothetical protein [Flavobacterium branchiicola]